jgi:citronellol/citronellal dehydrogenase
MSTLGTIGTHLAPAIDLMMMRTAPAVLVEAAPRLAKKRVLVTGASRGIGRATALRFAAEGASVALLARSHSAPVHRFLEGSLCEVARDVEALGGSALPLACDLRDTAATQRAIRTVLDAWGGELDVLVNNASALDLAHTPTPKQASLVLDVNARGTLVAALECERALRATGGAMVTLSPPVDLRHAVRIAAHPHYTLSKYAMTMVALGMAERGIASNSLWPRHLIATAATASLERRVPGAHSKGRAPSEFADVVYALAHSERTGQMLYDDEVLPMPATEALRDPVFADAP